jgi:hypothetical protein
VLGFTEPGYMIKRISAPPHGWLGMPYSGGYNTSIPLGQRLVLEPLAPHCADVPNWLCNTQVVKINFKSQRGPCPSLTCTWFLVTGNFKSFLTATFVTANCVWALLAAAMGGCVLAFIIIWKRKNCSHRSWSQGLIQWGNGGGGDLPTAWIWYGGTPHQLMFFWNDFLLVLKI